MTQPHVIKKQKEQNTIKVNYLPPPNNFDVSVGYAIDEYIS